MERYVHAQWNKPSYATALVCATHVPALTKTTEKCLILRIYIYIYIYIYVTNLTYYYSK